MRKLARYVRSMPKRTSAFPRKQTNSRRLGMSASCQSRPNASAAKTAPLFDHLAGAAGRRRLDGQRASVGEEGWRTARVEENDVVVWLPPSCPYECDETSKPFARIDRVKREGFEGTRQFDRFDCCVMRDAISRSGVAGDDFHIFVIERRLKEVGSGSCVSDNVRSHPLWLSVDVDPNHACAFERDRCANHETGLRCCTARTMNDGRRVEAASR